MAGSEGLSPVTFVVPGEPDQRTGGYRYVARTCHAINQLGVEASVMGIEGSFPVPDATAGAALDQALNGLANNAVVILDGLAMGGLPDVVARHAGRLRLISLVHHPLADETGLTDQLRDWLFHCESRALAAVTGVITTSRPTATRLDDFGVDPARVRVVEPGVDKHRSAARRCPQNSKNQQPTGIPVEILCVAHLSPRKAQHQLIEALARLRHLDWHCTLAGSTGRNPAYGHQIRAQIRQLGLEGRVTLAGELEDERLQELYACADIFVLPSLHEGYGMVIDEALAAGLPVVSSDGGALVLTADRPGIAQYPAGQVESLTQCLEHWLRYPSERMNAATAARESASSLATWQQVGKAFLDALAHLLETDDRTVFDLDWLALREPADCRARNPELTHKLITWAEDWYRIPGDAGHQRAPLSVVDLGSGAGANACFLVPRLTIPQSWTLVDQDAALLERAITRVERLDVPVTSKAARLAPDTLASQIPANTQLVTASALIDLVSGPWITALAAHARRIEAAVFVVLSYKGTFRLDPGDRDDKLVREAVNEHQHGNKGTGQALGPDAAPFLKQELEDRGYDVFTGDSPWHLAPDQPALLEKLLRGWHEAARAQRPDSGKHLDQWLDRRLQQVKEKQLKVHVDHLDLLAVPEREANGG